MPAPTFFQSRPRLSQAERRLTEDHRAALERETLRAKALAEAEGRMLEARNLEDVSSRRLAQQAEADMHRAVAVVTAALESLGAGGRELLADRARLTALAAGATLIAAGVYGSREGARVGFRYLEKTLGQPVLVRETSRVAPWRRLLPWGGAARGAAGGGGTDALRDVILEPALGMRVRQFAASTANTRANGAPFRNALFYGPPGTGKTLAAKKIATQSGLDYAVLTGGDVAPLGARAVTEIHALFEWAHGSSRGLVLFIDEADAFLARRGTLGTEEVRSRGEVRFVSSSPLVVRVL